MKFHLPDHTLATNLYFTPECVTEFKETTIVSFAFWTNAFHWQSIKNKEVRVQKSHLSTSNISLQLCPCFRRLPAVAYLLDAMCRCRHAARKDYSAGNTRGTTASLTDQTLSTLDPHHKRIHSEALAASPGSLATRRPSGLPVVRRQLTEKEQQLLKRVTAGRQQLCPLITVEEPSHVDGFLPDKKNIKRGQGKKIEPDDISQIHTMIIESDDITEGL